MTGAEAYRRPPPSATNSTSASVKSNRQLRQQSAPDGFRLKTARGALISSSLPALQNLIKRSSDSYSEEFTAQWSRFGSLVRIVQLGLGGTKKDEEDLKEITGFICQVAHLYPTVTGELPSILSGLLLASAPAASTSSLNVGGRKKTAKSDYELPTLIYLPSTAMSLKIILTGATGTAGSEAFRECLKNPLISQLTVLTRRPLPSHIYSPTIPPNPKIKIILHKDFNTYDDNLLKELEGSDGCLWDLGISANGMKESTYHTITHDYALSAAKAFSTLTPSSSTTSLPKKFVFAFLSGEGTHQDSPTSSWTMFGRIKGLTEAALSSLSQSNTNSKLAVYCFRPAGILPIEPIPEVSSTIVKLTVKILPFIQFIYPSFVIDTKTLARGMIEAIVKGGEGKIRGWEGKGEKGDKNVFNNEEIKKLAEESAEY